MELAILRRFGCPLPAQTLPYWNAFHEILPELEDRAPKEGFDAIWWEHSHLYPLVDMWCRRQTRKNLLICNTHNIESSLQARQAVHAGSDRERRWLETQARILRRTETRAFRRSDLVLCCSDEDRRLASGLSTHPLYHVAPNGVDLSHFQRRTRERHAIPTLLFTGTMSYPPNRDAVRYFLAEIFPRIQKEIEHCRFVIAGREAGKFAEELDSPPEELLVLDSPPDMRPAFEDAWIAVVPLRSGGGTRLKIFEAMAMECAVVSTSLGAEGVPYEDGKELLIRDDPEAFAGAVIDLIRDGELRRHLERDGLEFARDYDWSQIAKEAGEKAREVILSHTP